MRKMNKVHPRIMSGFVELLPADQILFEEWKEKIKKVYESFGFVPMDTPILELSEVLLAKIGEDTKKEIYRFEKGSDDISMRFDLTVPLARYVAMNNQSLVFPFKRYQIGKSFRGERPQKGRFREFYQADVDVIGNGTLSLISDAEVLSLVTAVFEDLKIGDFVVKVSNRKILSGLVKYLGYENKIEDVLRVVDKKEKIGEEKVTKMLLELGIENKVVEKMLEFLDLSGDNEEVINKLKLMGMGDEFEEGVSELSEVLNTIKAMGVKSGRVKINLGIVRGLSYYTGTVFETFLDNEEVVGSVCSGGRYDDLAESFSNNSFPGVGFSIGLTRLFSQLLSCGLLKAKRKTIAQVAVMSIDDDNSYALEVTSKLRKAGVKTIFQGESLKFSKKMDWANKLGVETVLIVGEEEKEKKKVTVKDMVTGKQEMVDLDRVEFDLIG